MGKPSLDDEAWDPEVAPGEPVLWSGRPFSRRDVAMRTWPQALFGAVFVTFYTFWTVMVARTHQMPEMAPFGIVFIAGGLLVLSAPIRAWWRAGQTRYLLTRRRAIVREPRMLGGWTEIDFFSDALDRLRVVEREDGSGDLILGTRPTRVNGMTEPVGFLSVERVREVEAIVRATLEPGGKNKK